METQFRKYFRDLLRKSGVWTASVEHRSGGTAGVGDLLVQLGEGALPVELKVGKWSRDGAFLHCSAIRPAQIGFMDEALRAGVAARLMIGTKDNRTVNRGWTAYMVRNVSADRLATWRDGFDLDELVVVSRGSKLLVPVTRW